MSHVDPDDLALIALGELAAQSADSEHIAACGQCSEELAALINAVAVGRSTLGEGELETPSPRVWSRIADELALTPAAATLELTTPVVSPDTYVAPVTELRTRRRWLTAVVGAAAAVALVAGGLIGWQSLQPDAVSVLATATLDAFPDWPGATGEAQVEERADGARVVHVSFAAPGMQDGYREAWLITSDAKSLVSLGVIRGNSGTFTVPDGIDISQYDLVDISDEPYDGNPTHSGDSIVRGQLTSVL